MKRFLVFLLIILLGFPLSVAGLVMLTYSRMDESSVPQPTLLVQEQEVSPLAYEWNTPVFGGLAYKSFFMSAQEAPLDLGKVEEEYLSLTAPSGYVSSAVISKNDVDMWSGSAENVSEFILLESGDYALRVNSRRERETGQGYGQLQYEVLFSAEVDVRIESSAEQLSQGDILAVQLYNLEPNAQVEGSSPFGSMQFTENGDGRQVAYLAASHDTEPGTYTVSVSVGERTFDVPVLVEEAAFPEQELEIDTSEEEISEANSAEAYAQYNETIPPLFQETDSNQYWNGEFIQPTEGELSTEYGLYRYTNGSETATRHAGIDLAAARGTEVIAPNAGRVILAEELLNTGNTLVIDHGNGLKSLFYHLDSLDVELGDTVSRGDTVGEVGSTGYSTGPHLHYEVRLFENTVDPLRLFDGSSGLYSFESDSSSALSFTSEEDEAA